MSSFWKLIAPMLLLAGACNLNGETASASPQLACQFGTGQWCVLQFAGSVEMKDYGAFRQWTFHSPSFDPDAPLVMEESKGCNGSADTFDVKKTSERVHSTNKNREMVKISFLISPESGCTLGFSSSSEQGKMTSPQYETMLTNFVVGNGWLGSTNQLRQYYESKP
ncbi:hypothetical protein [Niveispirillum sp. KHB5.9]|uniref:hypothetical protein n=1 Tax=Niveispirillum sp. KHB5.9 TaxID=3400269 RepID=UPI003A851232